MEEGLKSKDYKNISKGMMILYILNCTDAVFTRILLSTGMFMEINPLLKNSAGSSEKMLCLKIIFPAFLLIWIVYRVKDCSIKMKKLCQKLIFPFIVFYLLINLLHITGIILYLFFILCKII
ncbi:DUF5658 family protein [Clostridium polynesiense]|uniref:DUF5658 family protein n=1 Tax=Clostridium polynesiense TaxID=1325933 RepID=UPI00058FE04D|nr:DUF5658 family protein [Clostridium polynesiense]